MAVAPTPIRALLVAHWQSTKNRMVREIGRSGIWTVAILITLLGATMLVPFTVILFIVGFAFGRQLGDEEARAILGTVLTGLVVFGGAMSGASGGAKQLTWESYRGYPVRFVHVFIGEIIASFFDLVPVTIAMSVGATLLGIAVGEPSAIPLLPLLLAMGITTAILVQLLVGSLAERIIKRMRVAVVFVILATFFGAVSRTMLAADERLHTSDKLGLVVSILKTLERGAVWLPTTFAMRSLDAWTAGHYLEALLLLLYPLATIALLALIVYLMLVREAKGADDQERAPPRLWTFSTPALGIARVALQTIFESSQARFGLVIPLIVVGALRGPLAYFSGNQLWAVPGSFLYLSLSATQLELNQFGMDGHGIKTLLLLPIAPREIFHGKLIALSVYHAIQGIFLAVLLAVVLHSHPAHLAAGLLLFATLCLLQNAIGRLTSVRVPRIVSRSRMQAQAMPVVLILVGLCLSGILGPVCGLVFVAAAQNGASQPILAMAVLFAGSFAFHRLHADAADRAFVLNRERLLAALG